VSQRNVFKTSANLIDVVSQYPMSSPTAS